MITYRIAKPSDARQIANCHWHVRDRYSKGIFLSLGEHFLRTYYSITLNDPWEIIVCAVDEDNRIIGFSSTSLNAKKSADNLKKHKIRLGLSAMISIILKPSLFKPVLERYLSLGSKEGSPRFISNEGVRGGYWCWRKDDDSLKSVELSNVKNKILYDLGVRELFFEVDKCNKSVYRFHLKVNKAIPIEEITLPDGRVRVLMKKNLSY